MANDSFIKNVNALAANLDIIIESNDIFDESTMPILEEIALLDLDEAIADLRKGNYLGNRKLDINLALNMTGITEDLLETNPTAAEAIWTDPAKTVQYSSATVTFVDGVVIEMPFLFDGNPTTISTHGDLLIQLNSYVNVAAVAQVDTVSITLADSTLYTITINGIAYGYTSGVGATVPQILAGLLQEINVTQTNGIVPVTATDNGVSVILTADVAGTAFTTTVSASLTLAHTTTNVIAHTEESPFLAKLETTLVSGFSSPIVGELVRFYDAIGQNSNVERIQLHAASGDYIEASPIYFWAKTTSAFQTLSMRAGDIIKLGNEIDNLILLANSIEQVLELQARIPELIDTYTNEVANGDVTIYNKLAELLAIHTQLTGLIAIYNDIKVGGTNYIQTVSTNIADITTVAADLNLGAASNVKIVGSNIASVNATGGSISNVNTVATNITNVNLVAANIVPNLAEILLADDSAIAAATSAQLSEDYAVKLALEVELGTYSSKEYAIGDLTATGGSAKAWAIDASSPNGTTEKSAKTLAAEAAASAFLAAEKADEITAINGDQVAQTLAAGSAATAYYNSVTGKFTFGIPQGIKGDKGDAFEVNAVGLFSARSLYDTQPTGFSFLALDLAEIYFKLSNTSGDWSLGAPFGKGDTGNGIASITFTSTTGTAQGQAGETDTYTITYTDTTVDTFIVTNGLGIDSILFTSTTDISGLAGKSGATDTYTITYSNAATNTILVYNGLDSAVLSVAGRTGNVVLTKADVGLANVDNTSDSDKPVSTATQLALNGKVDDAQVLTNVPLGAVFTDTIFTGGNLTGALNEARATVISHATTADIWGALGNQIDFTGTATVTAFPNAPQAGATRELICAGACSFTAGANMLIDGALSGSTVTCAANDTVIVRAISTTQFKLTRVVSKDQFKTVNGVSIVGSGDITIGVFDTGDIATSSDYTKYPSPQWLECNGSNYDKAVYPALHAVTGYAGSTSAETGREVATCQTVLDRFSNYYKAAITAFFEYGNGVVFSKDESVAAVYVNATTVKIFRLDVPTNKYVLVTTFTTAAQCMSMDISNSGNWIAFTAGNNGYLLKWNGTTYAYATNSSVSVAAYQHHSCAISDSEAFVYYGCVTSVFGKIYPISTNGLETACTGTSIPSHSYKNPIWLPNEDKIVIVTTSIQMYGVSGTVATLIGTAITSISTGIGGTDFSSDRKYLIARKTVSPYTEIYKIATAGLSLIHSDVTANVSALMYFDENRAIRIVGDTLTTQIVYTINTSTDAVTSSAAAFDSPFFSSYDGNTNKWDVTWGVVRVKSLSTAGYIIAGTVFSEATFKWDSGTSKYKAYSARLATAWDISYNTTGQYGIVSNNNGAAFLVSIDQTTFEPIAGSLKSIQYPSILNSSTVSNNYFTSCPTMFVCIQYGNPNVYSLDLATGVFTIVDVSVLSISASTTGYSIIQISPTGEFIANLRSNDNTWMYGAYKAANGSYVGTTPLSNGTTAIGTLGQWTANNKLLIDDAATTGFKVVQFTSLSATTNFVTPLGTYYHFTDSAGRIFYCDSLYDYYVKYLDGTTQLLIAHSSLQNIYVSPNGEFIQIATNGYMYDAVTGLYVSIGSCALYGITSSLDFKQQLNRLFNKTLGCIMNGVSSYKTTFTNKVPLITPTATNMEKISKAFIKTGVA